MSKSKSKPKNKLPLAPSAGQPFNSALAGLGRLVAPEALPVQQAPASPAAAAPSADPWRAQGKLVLRREKKGRGGKTVTVLAGLTGMELEAVAQDLRKAMGCGAVVEGDCVVLQGEQGERAAAWLKARGARQIVVA